MRAAAGAIPPVDIPAPQRSAPHSLHPHDSAVPSPYSCAARPMLRRRDTKSTRSPTPAQPFAGRAVGSRGQPNVRDCDQVLPTLRFGVNPAHTKSSSDDQRAHQVSASRAALRARQRHKIGADLRPYNPASKEIETGRVRRGIASSSQDPNRPIVIRLEPKVALASRVVPLLSTPRSCAGGAVLTYA
jgi:hypothetical protein